MQGVQTWVSSGGVNLDSSDNAALAANGAHLQSHGIGCSIVLLFYLRAFCLECSVVLKFCFICDFCCRS